MDKAVPVPSQIQLDFCGVVTLEAPVVAKIDEGLGWWKSLREQARKVAQGALRNQRSSRMAEVWNLQVTLEQSKMFGANDGSKLRSTMSEFAKGLMNVQEMVKGLLGLEKEQPLS
jgi:hypothetical protein